MKRNICVNKTICTFIIILTIILLTLFWGDNVVMYDNGDYKRVMNLSSLTFQSTPKDFSSVITYNISLTENSFFKNVIKILFSSKDILHYPSIQVLFVRVCVVLNIFFNKLISARSDIFSIYTLGIMQSLIYAASLTFFINQIKLHSKVSEIIFKTAAIIILCDIGYVSYFNSLYGEGLQHIFLILSLGFILRLKNTKNTYANALLFSLSCIVYGLSKLFNIPAAAFLFIIYSAVLLRQKQLGKTAICIFSMCILIAAAAFIPGWMKTSNTYNSVFFGLLRHTNDTEAKKYLEDLSLPPELYNLKDTNYFVSNIEDITKNYNINALQTVSSLDISLAYLKNYPRLAKIAPYIAKNSGMIRNAFFLNNSHMRDRRKIHLWSRLREYCKFDTLFVNIFIAAVFLVLLLKKRYPLASAASAAGLMLYCFFMPYILNGDADLAKHMFCFIELTDIMLLLIFASVLNYFFKKPRTFFLSVACIMLFILPTLTQGYKENKIVSLGTYKNTPLKWTVIWETKESACLILNDILLTDSYSKNNSSLWETSNIRKRLNTEFILCFSEEERKNIIKTNHKVLLSKKDKALSVFGSRDFYCSPFPSLAASGYEEAYGCFTYDYIMLPNILHIQKMQEQSLKITCSGDYWLETPYFNNGGMNRYVSRDNKIYFKNSEQKLGVRPVIYIKK